MKSKTETKAVLIRDFEAHIELAFSNSQAPTARFLRVSLNVPYINVTHTTRTLYFNRDFEFQLL